MNYFQVAARRLFVFLWAAVISTASAQQPGLQDFRPLRASGKIPSYFSLPPEKQQELLNGLLVTDKDEKLQEQVLNRLTAANYMLMNRFADGELLFGDTLSAYINAISRVIIQSNPHLPTNLEFYVSRAPEVNASTYPMGIIVVNVGLIAHAGSEAELAAVLCHEIAHYTLRHSVKATYEHLEDSKRKKQSSQRYGEFVQERIDRQYSRSRGHELEADSAGLLLYKNTGYAANEFLSLFHMLHNADNSYGDLQVHLDDFTVDGIRLPESFWIDSVKTSAPFQEHSDRYYTHPNAGIRLSQATRLAKALGTGNDGASFQLADLQTFAHLRNLARFEQLRLLLVSRQYGDVIYNAHVLSASFPGNRYLETCMAKAWYGLARYKNADAFSEVARRYTQVEGESQRVHYMVKQFNRRQLSAYTLKVLINTSKKYPSPLFDSLKADIIRDLVVINEVEPSSFNAGSERDKLFASLIKQEITDPGLRKMFENNYHLLVKKKEDDLKPANVRRREQLALENRKKKFGPGIKAQKVLVEIPYVSHTDKDGLLLPDKTEVLRNNFFTAVEAVAKETNLHCTPLRSGENADDVYNRIALVNELLAEVIGHSDHGFRPVVSDFLFPLIKEYETPFLYFSRCRYNQGTRKHLYASALFDLNACRVRHQRVEHESGEPSLKALRSFIEEDFNDIKR